MKIITDTQKITDPNNFGEMLRNYCFINDGYEDIHCKYREDKKQIGCYETFELRPEFKEQSLDTEVGQYAQEHLIGTEESFRKDAAEYDWDEAGLNEALEFMRSESDRINVHYDGNILVAWYWDGDGTLLFREGDKAAINHDCKKDYEWEWIKE